jgi:hypothetical protein
MRSLLFSTVATAALLTGSIGAVAQQDMPRRDQPSSEQTQQTPRRDQGKEWPGARPQSEPQRQGRSRAQPERSTTGQSSDRSAEQPRSQEGRGDVRGQEPRRDRADDQNRSRERTTTGQSQDRTSQPGARSRDRAGDDRDLRRDRTTAGPSQERSQDRTTKQDRVNRSEQTTARGSLQMSQDQRARVTARFSQSIDRMNVRPLSRANISVSIGAPLPRSVRFYPVPRDIVAIYPQFRSHRFVLVDDEIVIIEPRSRRVVTVLQRDGGSRVSRSVSRETTGSAAPGTRLTLEPRVREEIRTVVMSQPACRLEQRVDFFLFVPLPRTVEVCELPQQIITDAPELRGYRYVVRGDEIGLVDPDDHRIVEVIR